MFGLALMKQEEVLLLVFSAYLQRLMLIIGPMVYAAAYWCEDENEEISKKGFDGIFFLKPISYAT